MLHSLEIIENIQITQLNFEKILFGGLPKQEKSRGTQCLKKAPNLLFSCCSQFQRKRTIYQFFTVFRPNIFVRTNDLICGLSVCPIICPIIYLLCSFSNFYLLLSSFRPPLYLLNYSFFKELWSFVIRFSIYFQFSFGFGFFTSMKIWYFYNTIKYMT